MNLPTRSPGLDLTAPEAPIPLGDGTYRAARLAVCSRAHDAEDARDLLAVLGLIVQTLDEPVEPRGARAGKPLALTGRADHPSGPLRGRVIA